MGRSLQKGRSNQVYVGMHYKIAISGLYLENILCWMQFYIKQTSHFL